ncbi:hypothetical protein RHSIM_RhsimUnG0208500 [Rhododendron simsii]|uniref:Uncharacterized protein n=1 Tax=Rhododendron simsii TaxID=118357 RepID=A0A834FU94_RHOSS|nr:hypothetical protein RHSIM_RhsimUnG0208500 [Rhododendron simsii]
MPRPRVAKALLTAKPLRQRHGKPIACHRARQGIAHGMPRPMVAKALLTAKPLRQRHGKPIACHRARQGIAHGMPRPRVAKAYGRQRHGKPIACQGGIAHGKGNASPLLMASQDQGWPRHDSRRAKTRGGQGKAQGKSHNKGWLPSCWVTAKKLLDNGNQVVGQRWGKAMHSIKLLLGSLGKLLAATRLSAVPEGKARLYRAEQDSIERPLGHEAGNAPDVVTGPVGQGMTLSGKETLYRANVGRLALETRRACPSRCNWWEESMHSVRNGMWVVVDFVGIGYSFACAVKSISRTTAKAFAKDVFINQERKLGARRRSDTVLVSTINDADQGSADVTFRTPLAPYEKSKFLGSGGSMVARLKLKGIDGRAPPGVEPAA